MPPAVASAGDAAGVEIEIVEAPPLRDGLSRAQAAEIDRAVAAYYRRHPGRALPKLDVPPRFPFFPQAGVLGRDLFLNNFTDQDPAVGLVRDWDCSDYTYDGHQGHDSLIRSFREQAIGVPVFAVLPGVVVDVHDGEPDQNVEWKPENRANYVVVDHGGGLTTLYFHLKSGSVAVVPNQVVTAGAQLGLTGSSGLSNWPHLHLETRLDNRWTEPSAGPCRSGDSLWSAQPPVPRDAYVADLYLSRGPLSAADVGTYLRDEASRAGSFRKGRQTVGVRVDVRNLPATAGYRLRVLDPRRRPALDLSDALANRDPLHLAFLVFSLDLDLRAVGTWRLLLEADGVPPIEAPFRVVASASQLRNRPPAKVTATLTPAKPVEDEVLTCTVNTSAVTEDPDYDVVAYRYEWRVNRQLVRSVTSAALSDVLAAGRARPGEKVTCKVTPIDVASAGQATTAATTD